MSHFGWGPVVYCVEFILCNKMYVSRAKQLNVHTFMTLSCLNSFVCLVMIRVFFFSLYCCCLSQSSFNHAVFGYFSANVPGHGRAPNHWWLDFPLMNFVQKYFQDSQMAVYRATNTAAQICMAESCSVCTEIFATPKLNFICQGD